MNAENFMQEVVQFVKTIAPEAKWEFKNNYAVLFLKDSKKTICVLPDSILNEIQGLSYNYFLNEYIWNKNKEASKSRLCSLLGTTQRIHGRQCVIRKISKNEARRFVDTNHTMGYAEAHFNYALFFKDQLVAVACFSKGRPMHRLPAGRKSFELIRFCNQNFFTVVGGLSKLIRYFEEEQNPGDIMTYVDRNWGEPHAYYLLGFALDKISEPMTTIVKNNEGKKIEYTNKGNYKLIKHLV